MRLTETARNVLLEAVRGSGLADGRCLRLVWADSGYALTVDTATGWDTVLQEDKTSILVVAKDVEESLSRATIEAKEDDGVFQLIVRNQAAGVEEQREVA